MSEERRDCISMKTRWTIEKFEDDEAVKENKPYEVEYIDGNLAMNAGIDLMWDLTTAAGGQGYDNSNAYIGVGNDNTAAAAAQTDLIGTNARVGMNGGYPTTTSQIATFQSDFGSAVGNFDWEEWGVFNAAAAGTMLNRKVSSQGTKVSGQTWQVTLAITMS